MQMTSVIKCYHFHVSWADYTGLLLFFAENGVELQSSSDDEDKTGTEVKAAAPAGGPVTHPIGMICLLVYM